MTPPFLEEFDEGFAFIGTDLSELIFQHHKLDLLSLMLFLYALEMVVSVCVFTIKGERKNLGSAQLRAKSRGSVILVLLVETFDALLNPFLAL
jgi:hypothetical protein